MIYSSVSGYVGSIIIDRPQKLNALTTDMLDCLKVEIDNLVDLNVKIIVIRGNGKHFSAGADLNEWLRPTADEAQRMSRVGEQAFSALASTPMPTLAVIDGVAVGGGLELALACDLRIASVESKIGLPEASLGNLPSYGGINRLVEVVGVSRAREILFTAESISGKRAAEMGLVNWISSASDLDTVVEKVVGKIIDADAESIALAKSLTGGSPIDGLLARVTSQSNSSHERKALFVNRKINKGD